MRVEAVIVNHNTSKFAEPALRSLFATHPDVSGLRVTLLDNDSQDGTPDLFAYAHAKDVVVAQSGFSSDTVANSHADVLQRFVLDRPDADAYRFLDADVFFHETDVLGRLVHVDPERSRPRARRTTGPSAIPGSTPRAASGGTGLTLYDNWIDDALFAVHDTWRGCGQLC